MIAFLMQVLTVNKRSICCQYDVLWLQPFSFL